MSNIKIGDTLYIKPSVNSVWCKWPFVVTKIYDNGVSGKGLGGESAGYFAFDSFMDKSCFDELSQIQKEIDRLKKQLMKY